MNKEKLWMLKDGGNYGFIGGLFLATDEEVYGLIGKELHFGEVEGKHSEVVIGIEEGDVELISEDEKFIEIFKEKLGRSYAYNPLDYDDEEDDCDE